MMKNTIYCKFLILTVIFIISCRNDNYEVTENTIDQKEFIVEKPDLNKLYIVEDKAEYKLINLELKQEALIDNILNALFINEKFYLLAQDGTAILVFNKEGKYLKKLKSIGKGPGEYINISQMVINNQKLYLGCDFNEVIKVYELESFTYLNEINIPKGIIMNEFSVLDDKIVMSKGFTEEKTPFPYQLNSFKIEQSGIKKLETELPYRDDMDLYTKNPTISVKLVLTHENNLLYSPFYDNTIHKFDKNLRLISKYKICFPESTNRNIILEDIRRRRLKDIWPYFDKLYFFTSYFETKDFIIVPDMRLNKNPAVLIHSKDANKSETYSLFFSKTFNCSITVYSSYQDFLIGSIDPNSINNRVQELLKKARNDKLTNEEKIIFDHINTNYNMDNNYSLVLFKPGL